MTGTVSEQEQLKVSAEFGVSVGPAAARWALDEINRLRHKLQVCKECGSAPDEPCLFEQNSSTARCLQERV